MINVILFPPLLLSFTRKTKEWRKKCINWADSKSVINCSLVRKSVMHKKISYDLLNGKLHMLDLLLVLNPNNTIADFIPDNILHYPIMNAKLNVLRGEESKRVFDYRVVITNPNAVSEIENNKKKEILARMQLIIQDQSLSEEEFNAELERINDYFMYEWLDMREIRSNALLNHYIKELNIPLLFNQGFMDAMAIGEEIYQCDIVGGEPIIERVDPLKIRVFKSGYSNKIEDADLIIMEDYWSPGKIIDTYYDVLTKKDMEYLEKSPNHLDNTAKDEMDNIDERYGFIDSYALDDGALTGEGFHFDGGGLFSDAAGDSLLPYDLAGNIKVLRVYWKSRRKIKKVKSYDPITGDEIFTFYPETYVINKELGEEEEIYWINEAWEGTKIGKDIYVNMRPRTVLYNRLSNPSRCHFGIVGSIYNLNNSKPFSLVDMMKPYNYLYDAVHDRLNKLLAKNWGKIIELDLAKVPAGWDISKWLYYATNNSIAVIDSFKEGNVGAATGKLAGGLNNASRGVIDAELGNIIQLNVNLLEFIKSEMADVAGISKQREGQISNRETVGGVERATLQSSHITEWLFILHDDVKKRALECFLETAKIALKGRSKKFQYIMSDNSIRIMDIDGDEFAESDYGLVVDNSNGVQELQQKIDALAQAALLNLILNFSTIMKLYNSSSLAEKQRMVEKNEREILQRQQEAQQLQLQAEQEQAQLEAQAKEAEMQLKDQLNQRDNETKIIVAEINGQAEALRFAMMFDQDQQFTEKDKATLEEQMRLFDAKLKLDKEKLNFEKSKAKTDAEIKRQQIRSKSQTKK